MFGPLFGKELLENVRTHRLLVLAVVMIFFGILSPVTARYMSQILSFAASGQEGMEQFLDLIPPPTILDSVDQYVKNLTGIDPDRLRRDGLVGPHGLPDHFLGVEAGRKRQSDLDLPITPLDQSGLREDHRGSPAFAPRDSTPSHCCVNG